MVKTPPLLDDERNEIKDEEDDEEDETEVKEQTLEKENHLASVIVPVRDARKDKSRWKTTISIQVVIDNGGSLNVSAWEIGKSGSGDKVVVSVAAP
jgi:heat shock 70kDa protein 1/2/6/8